MARVAAPLTRRVLAGAVLVVVVAAIVVARQDDVPSAPPLWLQAKVRGVLAESLEGAEPQSITYHLGERRHHVAYRFEERVLCAGCSPSSVTSLVRGMVAQAVFDARTHRLESFAACAGTRWCIDPDDD